MKRYRSQIRQILVKKIQCTHASRSNLWIFSLTRYLLMIMKEILHNFEMLLILAKDLNNHRVLINSNESSHHRDSKTRGETITRKIKSHELISA